MLGLSCGTTCTFSESFGQLASLYSFHGVQAACKPFSQLPSRLASFQNVRPGTTLLCIIESGPTSLKTGWQVYKPVAIYKLVKFAIGSQHIQCISFFPQRPIYCSVCQLVCMGNTLVFWRPAQSCALHSAKVEVASISTPLCQTTLDTVYAHCLLTQVSSLGEGDCASLESVDIETVMA